jgi:thioesterase domain-containing protein
LTDLIDASAVVTPLTSDLRAIFHDAWRAAGACDQNDVGFDEGGGDSLMLMNLVFRLEYVLGKKIPLELFELGMTFDEMLERLVARFDPPFPTQMQGHDGAVKTVFMLPGIGGDEPRLAMMRNQCAGRLRIVPIQYPDWRDLLNPAQQDFGKLVDHIVQQIDTSPSDEPVSLIGYSFGCRVAHGVVASLIRQGRNVAAPVVLLDGPSDGGDPGGMPPFLIRPADSAYQAFGFFFLRRLIGPGGMLGLRLIAAVPRRFVHHRWLGFTTIIRLEYFLAVLQRWAVGSQYRPQRVDTTAVLFRAADNVGAEDKSLGWSSLWRDLEVLHVSGDHYTMFDGANLQELSNQVASAFAR